MIPEHERIIRAALIETAATGAEDMLEVVVRLLGAATCVFSTLQSAEVVRGVLINAIDLALCDAPAGRA